MTYKKNNLRLNFNNFILIFITLFMLLNFKIKPTFAEERSVIKVGYPIIENFTDIKNGIYTGYAFDYLFEISKYTGWKFEFIQLPLNEALDKLQS